MAPKRILISEIKRLSNVLDEHFSNELNFRNHCYLRIAFDAAIHDKWSIKVAKPFVKYATEGQLLYVLDRLNLYLTNKTLLLSDNEKSLIFRENHKKIVQKNNPELF